MKDGLGRYFIEKLPYQGRDWEALKADPAFDTPRYYPTQDEAESAVRMRIYWDERDIKANTHTIVKLF